MKTLAARDNGVHFLVSHFVAPVDPTRIDGITEFPQKERGANETAHVSGCVAAGAIGRIQVLPLAAEVGNMALLVEPSRLVTRPTTER